MLYTPDPQDPSTHIQVGIVSGGSAGDCGSGLPVVFSRVDHYADWIAKGIAAVDAGQGLGPDAQAVPGAPAAAGQRQP